MRMRHQRVTKATIKNKSVTKDNEGVPIVTYINSHEVDCEIWPATDRLQAHTYGDRINSIQNMKIRGEYEIIESGKALFYVFSDFYVSEGDGVCVYSDEPDYKVISVKPYKPLRLEIERLT